MWLWKQVGTRDVALETRGDTRHVAWEARELYHEQVLETTDEDKPWLTKTLLHFHKISLKRRLRHKSLVSARRFSQSC